METFIDYYAVLGINEKATASAIKAAFKKLALQYHPDVYKGEDAQERMRTLLLAYQTLSDDAARRAYDAHRLEHFLDKPGRRVRTATQTVQQDRSAKVSARARRDRQRRYDFPILNDGYPAEIDLGDSIYHLSPEQARTLKQEGLLRGVADEPQPPDYSLFCHRCRQRSTPPPGQHHLQAWEDYCPHCNASDWAEYLLLRCVHCAAVFESEQIRYEIGTYHYGDDTLCPPYELFPLCPYCGTSKWCPTEDVRVNALRAAAAKRARTLQLVWTTVIVMAILLLGVVMLFTLR